MHVRLKQSLHIPDGKILLCIFLIAFIIRIISTFFVLPVIDPGILDAKNQGDGLTYDDVAMHLLKGEGYGGTSTWPGYSTFLAIVYFLFGRSFTVVRVIQAILGSLTCVLIYFLGKSVFSARVGTIAAGLSVIYPFFLRYTALVHTETLAVLLVTSMTLMMIKYHKEPSAKNCVRLGVIVGVSTLIKPVIFGFPIFLLIVMLLTSQHKLISLKNFGIILVIFSILLAPWIVRNSLYYNEFVLLPRAGADLYNSNVPTYKYRFSLPQTKEQILKDPKYKEIIEQKEEVFKHEGSISRNIDEIDKRGYRMFLNNIIRYPDEFIKGLWFKFKEFWRPIPHPGSPRWTPINIIITFLSAGLISLLGFAGMIVSYKRWRTTIFLIALVVYFTLFHTLIIGLARYRLPIMPIMMVFASYILNEVLKKWRIMARRV